MPATASSVPAAADRAIVRDARAHELLTSYSTGKGEPWPFYERLGFAPTGELDPTVSHTVPRLRE